LTKMLALVEKKNYSMAAADRVGPEFCCKPGTLVKQLQRHPGIRREIETAKIMSVKAKSVHGHSAHKAQSVHTAKKNRSGKI